MLLYIILATLVISIISLVGILVSYKKIKSLLHLFISFAAATLVGVAFFDLIPHAIEELEGTMHVHESIVFVVIGIVLFFLIEKLIHWHHCDKGNCKEGHCGAKPAGVLILTGDFVHNFLDGVLIAGAFMLDFTTGIITAFTVAIHEIPQEFGDFAVLIHSGFSKKKAILLNFFSAFTAVLGGVLGYFMFGMIEKLIPFAVLITAGGFLYVALSDIVPAMHKHCKKHSIMFLETTIFVVTIVVLYFFLGMLH